MKLEVVITKKVFYKNGWGIFGCKPKNKMDFSKVETHPIYGNFTIKGTVMELVEGDDYTIEVGDIERSPKGNSYPLLKLHMPKNTSSKSQFLFLKSVMTDKQYLSFIKLYPESGKEKVLDMIKNGEIDLTKVKGVGDKAAQIIINRIIQQEEKIHIINKLMPIGVTDKMIDKIIDHYGSVPLAIQKINESMYNLCEVEGLGFKKVDSYALQNGEDVTSPKRIEAYLNYLTQQNTQEGHSWTSVEDVVKAAKKELKIDAQYIENFIQSINTNKESYLLNIDGRITTKFYYGHELNVFNHLNRINQKYIRPQLNNDELEKIIQDVEDELQLQFTEEQRYTILESFNHGVYVINGGAGTGKSTIMKGISEIANKLNLLYRAIALSGRASQLLSIKGIDASTIHRLLGYDGTGFSHNEENPFEQDLIIIEEASMANAYLISSILQAVKDGAKVIIVGDSGQLSGIGYGDVLRDLLQTNVFAGNELTKILRQAEGSGIIEMSYKVRNGEQLVQYAHNVDDERLEYLQLKNTYGENADLSIVTYLNKEKLYKSAYSAIRTYFSKLTPETIMDFQILVSNKSRGVISCEEVNKFCQNIYLSTKSEKLTNNTYDFYVGDKVIVSGNKYGIAQYKTIDDYYFGDYLIDGNGEMKEFDLFNGTMGIVEAVNPNEQSIIVKFEGFDGYIAIESDELSNIDLAYAATIHRCVSPDTFVYTNKGVMTIKDSFDIEDLKVFNGKEFIIPVDKIYLKDEKTLKVTTSRGFFLEGTPDHKLITSDEHGNLLPVTLDTLTDGDVLYINKKNQLEGNVIDLSGEYYQDRKHLNVRTVHYNRPKILDDKLSLFLGLLVADGTVFNGGLRYSKKYKECTDLFVKLTGELFNYKCKEPFLTEDGAWSVDISSKDIVDYVRKFDGVHPNNKFIPSVIMNSTIENQRAFLKGLFEDGTVNLKKESVDHVELSMKGEKIIRQTQMLLLNMGIISSVKLYDTRGYWSLYIYGSEIYKYKKLIGFISEFKNERLSTVNESQKMTATNDCYYGFNKQLLNDIKLSDIKLKQHQLSVLRNKDRISINLFNLIYDKFVEKNIIPPLLKRIKYIVDNFISVTVESITESTSDVYCYTVPKGNVFIQNGFYGMNCQGMSIPNTLTLLDYGAFKLLSKQLLYTGMTRASKKGVVLAEHNALHMAIKTDASGLRRTFLGDFLSGNLIAQPKIK